MFSVEHFPSLVQNLPENIRKFYRGFSGGMNQLACESKMSIFGVQFYAQCAEFEQLVHVAVQTTTDTFNTVEPCTWYNDETKNHVEKDLIAPFHRQVGLEDVYYHPLCALLHMTYFQPNATKKRYAFRLWTKFMGKLRWNLPSTALLLYYFHKRLEHLFTQDHFSVDAVQDLKLSSWYMHMLNNDI